MRRFITSLFLAVLMLAPGCATRSATGTITIEPLEYYEEPETPSAVGTFEDFNNIRP